MKLSYTRSIKQNPKDKWLYTIVAECGDADSEEYVTLRYDSENEFIESIKKIKKMFEFIKNDNDRHWEKEFRENYSEFSEDWPRDHIYNRLAKPNHIKDMIHYDNEGVKYDITIEK